MRTLYIIAATIFLSSAVSAQARPAKGERLFKSKCGGCHSVGKQKVIGPGLEGITKRKSPEWILRFMQNPQGTWESNDPETVELKKRLFATDRKKTKMKVRLKKGQAPKILEYLKTL